MQECTCKYALLHLYSGDMDIINPVSEIEQLALENGVSVGELCSLANVARTTFTRWKNGTTQPNYSTLARFKEAINGHKVTKVKSNKHRSS